jgi:hypothetical protein
LMRRSCGKPPITLFKDYRWKPAKRWLDRSTTPIGVPVERFPAMNFFRIPFR